MEKTRTMLMPSLVEIGSWIDAMCPYQITHRFGHANVAFKSECEDQKNLHTVLMYIPTIHRT